jgi:hypothetical protein
VQSHAVAVLADGGDLGPRVAGSETASGDALGNRRIPFPPEVILFAVRWHLRYGLSYRDLEELLAERGIKVDHVTRYRWVQRFTPLLIDAARVVRHPAEDLWFVDETYVKVAGVWSYVYRAVDQHGRVIDVYVSNRRDIGSARGRSFGCPDCSRRPGRGDHRSASQARALSSALDRTSEAGRHFRPG